MSAVFGTAGHVDHGKSALVKALTGTDPDRLAEERLRGMTIDLGFAHGTLPSGRYYSIIDAPGHARFIRNMLAGVHGMDAVILVIAADEGIQAQTREHLDIITLLGIRRGIVAITKIDLVDEQWLLLMQDEVRRGIEKTTLKGSETIRVSALYGVGIAEIRDCLDAMLAGAEPKAQCGFPRLPVDRAFTMTGFGTVVTGTLVDGEFRVGDEVEVAPLYKRGRIRGIQVHGNAVEVVSPGSRVAVNISGIGKQDLDRGCTLVRPDGALITRRVDASILTASNLPRPLRSGESVTLHLGTAEIPSRMTLLDSPSINPGGSGWVQLLLSRDTVAAVGDRFILRNPVWGLTLAGGLILDPLPRHHSRHDARVLVSLAKRAAGDTLAQELEKHPEGITAEALAKSCRIDVSALQIGDAKCTGGWMFSRTNWNANTARITGLLQTYHAEYPLRRGMPFHELAGKLHWKNGSLSSIIAALVNEGAVVQRVGAMALPSHEVQIEDSDVRPKLIELLSREPLAPPPLPQALVKIGATMELARAMAECGDIVIVSDDLAFASKAYDHAISLMRALIARDGRVTVGAFRDAMKTSRDRALAVLEYFDSTRLTRRVGNDRVLR